MEISTTSRGEAIVIAVSGRVDAATAPAFEATILELIASGQLRLVIDLSNLEYINSAWLRALLVAGKRLKPQGGRLLLAAPREPVRQVLQISGFSTMFETCATAEEARSRVCRRLAVIEVEVTTESATSSRSTSFARSPRRAIGFGSTTH